MRILVCGGRSFDNAALMDLTLDQAHDAGPITVLIHGLAKGADALAADWANRNNVRVQGFRPDWKKYGKLAGPIRNERMLKEGMPQLVLAFKGSKGTADMVRQARHAGVPVLEIE
jgi:YspA, cpYpsA-related SLOG family